jgi:pimeloyl-ACP methyl ester carboxylesterase
VRHPERVSHLVLYGGFALGGYRRSSAEREKRQAMAALMRLGWDGEDPTFRQMFASQLIPDATKEQVATFTRHQRETTTGECAARYYEAVGNFDVRDLLEKVSVPTLVMHVRGDLVCPIEAGRAIAGAIPGARFVTLPGTNHIPIEGDPASDRFLDEIGIFLDG